MFKPLFRLRCHIGCWLAVTLVLLAAATVVTTNAQSIAGFEDELAFKLFLRESRLGVINSSIDPSGRYARTCSLSTGGQTAVYTMSVRTAEDGTWAMIDLENPAKGAVKIRNSRGVVSVLQGEGAPPADLPADYVLYDDFGVIFESLMLRRYDMDRGGPQTFSRVRYPETFPGWTIDVEITYLGDETRPVNGHDIEFHVFEYAVKGVRAKYWVDAERRVYLIDSPVEQMVGVRAGYEDLLPFRDRTDELSMRKRTESVPMRDGEQLSLDLYFPDVAPQDLPAILIRTPYKKEMLELEGYHWARNGYVCAVQDVRGRFASDGEWEPFVNEGPDGYDTIEWLASREWCNGRVGMVGASYLGYAQLVAAVEKPPHLITIIPSVAPPDPFYNIPYEYGCFFMLGSMWWNEVIEREATADLTGKTLTGVTDRDWYERLKALPVNELDTEILGARNATWRKWTEHNTNDSYWKRASYLERLATVDIPVFLQTGWFDGDGIGAKLAYEALKKSRSPYVKLIIGPWGHQDQASTHVGGREVGEEAGIDLSGLYLRWCDHWLKGVDNGILEEAPVSLYAMNSNRWLHGDDYPLPASVPMKLYLQATSGAVMDDGDGRLQWNPPTRGREFDAYRYDPADPTPSRRQRARSASAGEKSRAPLQREDILVYETEPLSSPMTIAGPMSFTLYAATSARDTDWFVALAAVDCGGEEIPLARGAIRARFRESTEHPRLLDPDRVYEYTIDMWHTGITVRAGEKLRVEISSAWFPEFSRNLNTGGHNEMDTERVVAEQKVYHSQHFASHLTVPVVQGLSDDVAAAGQEPSSVERLAGEYKLRPGLIMAFTARGGVLELQVTGEDKVALLSESPTRFTRPDGQATFEFVIDTEGRVPYVRVVRGGVRLRAVNLAGPAAEKPATRQEVDIDPALCERYAGEYVLAPGKVITVTVSDGQLVVQLTGQPAVPVYAASKNQFFYKIVDAAITFEMDGEDVTALVLEQNGMVMEAPRKGEAGEVEL